jgi:pimeloyl-ACP methyl ester carboxylesterase
MTEVTDPLLPPWPGETQQLQGLSIFVRRAVNTGAPAAVFVHGLGGAATNWTDLMGLLADDVDGYALDLPGFGHSAPPASGRYPLELHVGAVVSLIESIGAGPVHLFGNSLGGATATRLAARHPDLVRTLTLISPALPDLKPRLNLDWRLPLMLVPGVGPQVQKKLAAVPAEQRVAGLMDLVYYDPAGIPAQRLAEAAAEVVRRDGLAWRDAAMVGSLRGLVRAQLERGSRALWAEAASVTAPTLLVWGRHDKLVNVAVSAKAVKTFPNASLLVLDDAGHVAQLERPQAVADAWRARFR